MVGSWSELYDYDTATWKDVDLELPHVAKAYLFYKVTPTKLKAILIQTE